MPGEGASSVCEQITREITQQTTEQTVQQDAYTATEARTSMPSTGIFLLPAAGLTVLGAGILVHRRRG
ncbi:MAG TPA: hypothetical protein ENH44_01565 [Actinobacteria bacterium]|nr:hypothetical protein [Actinomycetota bacterium]